MNQRLKRVILILLLAGFLLETAWGFDHSHRVFDDILKEAVLRDGSKSRVRYGWLKQNPDRLNQYVREIEAVTRSEYDQWTHETKLAFLINAYNALTIQLVLTRYPDLTSIRDLGGFFSGPWKIRFFTLFGEKQHLDYIEHGILRKDFIEPRIHFVLVCASISCPALREEAFTPADLEKQLADATRRFLQDRDRNAIDAATGTLYLSSIFKWFRGDFEKTSTSVAAFVTPWMTDDGILQQNARSGKLEIEYLDYDWNLNRVE